MCPFMYVYEQNKLKSHAVRVESVGVVHEMYSKTSSDSSNRKQQSKKHMRACWLTKWQVHLVANEQGCPHV